VYPNFVPEEGFLPLSKGQLQPSENGPLLESPGCEPGAETCPPTTSMESGPEPRLSPTPERPANDRYGLVNGAEAVMQASGVEPARLPASSDTLQLGAFPPAER